MRPARNSSRPRGVSTRNPPRSRPPRNQAPPPWADPTGPGTPHWADTPPDQAPPCEQNSWNTLVKILSCPKLRLRAVKNDSKLNQLETVTLQCSAFFRFAWPHYIFPPERNLFSYPLAFCFWGGGGVKTNRPFYLKCQYSILRKTACIFYLPPPPKKNRVWVPITWATAVVNGRNLLLHSTEYR